MHFTLLGRRPNGLHANDSPPGNHTRVDRALWNDFLAPSS